MEVLIIAFIGILCPIIGFSILNHLNKRRKTQSFDRLKLKRCSKVYRLEFTEDPFTPDNCTVFEIDRIQGNKVIWFVGKDVFIKKKHHFMENLCASPVSVENTEYMIIRDFSDTCGDLEKQQFLINLHAARVYKQIGRIYEKYEKYEKL